MPLYNILSSHFDPVHMFKNYIKIYLCTQILLSDSTNTPVELPGTIENGSKFIWSFQMSYQKYIDYFFLHHTNTIHKRFIMNKSIYF